MPIGSIPSSIAPGVGATTIGSVASAAALPISLIPLGIQLARRARQKRAEANAQIAAAGGNPNPAFPGYDQYGNPQVENPNNPGFDMAGFPLSYAQGPGSGPMTNPTAGGAGRTVADIARNIPHIPLGSSPGARVPLNTGVDAPVPAQPPNDMPQTQNSSLVRQILPISISTGTSIIRSEERRVGKECRSRWS